MSVPETSIPSFNVSAIAANQRCDTESGAADKYDLNIETLFLKEPQLLGNPNRHPVL